jgi:hypothetical protein
MLMRVLAHEPREIRVPEPVQPGSRADDAHHLDQLPVTGQLQQVQVEGQVRVDVAEDAAVPGGRRRGGGESFQGGELGIAHSRLRHLAHRWNLHQQPELDHLPELGHGRGADPEAAVTDPLDQPLGREVDHDLVYRLGWHGELASQVRGRIRAARFESPGPDRGDQRVPDACPAAVQPGQLAAAAGLFGAAQQVSSMSARWWTASG